METRAALRKYVPASFSVGNGGKVYDAYGDESAQADIVIANPDHLFSYPPGSSKPGAYIIEGVMAVGKAHSVLMTTELERSISAAQAPSADIRAQ